MDGKFVHIGLVVIPLRQSSFATVSFETVLYGLVDIGVKHIYMSTAPVKSRLVSHSGAPGNQPQLPAQVLFDGRLLDANTGEPLKRKPGADDHGVSHSGKQPSKGTQQGRLRQDEKPLTPPHVNGVSLAPVADSECIDCSKDKDPKRKVVCVKAQLPHGKTTNDTVPQNSRAEQLDSVKLVAKGRSIHRFSSQNLAKLTIFQEINDIDSLCATPASMPLDMLRDCVESRGPLGPLTPQPLSPSILTVCNAADLGFDPDAYQTQDWQGFDYLPDMTRNTDTPASAVYPSTA